MRAGLESLAELAPERVLVHDAARPLVSAALIDRVLGALDRVSRRPARAAGRRHAQAGGRHGRAGRGRSHRPRQGADPAGVPLRRDPGGASCSRAFGLYRRHGDRRRRRPASGLGRRRGEEPEADPARGSERGRAAFGHDHALAHRPRVRRACLRAGPTSRAVRGHGAARAGARRPFRRRRRLPCDHRRDPGHDRGRRHRHAFPAQRPAMARRGFRPVPAPCRRPAGRAARADRERRPGDRLRAAEDRAAPGGHGGAHWPRYWGWRRTRSASRPPPASASASPAAARASPPRPWSAWRWRAED